MPTKPNRNNNTSEYYWKPRPRRVRGGIKARSVQGEFAKNWWARRWIQAMERLMDVPRLQRGRTYARAGQVLSLEEMKGGMTAKVQGSRQKPYRVSVRLKPLTDEQWDKVLDVLADRAIFAAQLLSGEMPYDIEEAFSTAEVSLFPADRDDLLMECSCPDWANPCKHIAATFYILGDRFDEDPFLLFRLRGRGQDQLLQGLRQRRMGGDVTPELEEEEEIEEPTVLLEELVDNFWQIGPLDDFSVSVQPPSIPMPVLKRLGEPDVTSGLSLAHELKSAYEAMHQAAMMMAFSDFGPASSPDES